MCARALRDEPHAWPTQNTLRVSLLIAAYNEQQVIEAKLMNSLELDYPSDLLEIAVASESTDRTNEMISALTPRVKLFAYTRRGKASMLFHTVPQLTGDIVIFSDANAFYERDAVKRIVQHFANPHIGCVSGKLVYTPHSKSSGSESAYWRYENCIKRLESRLQSLLGANGSIFAIRRKLYSPLSENRGDDFELPVQVLLQGQGVVLEEGAISREDDSVSDRSEFRRRVRQMALMPSAAMLLVRALHQRKWLIVLQIISHKFLRWFLAVFLIAAFALNVLLLHSRLFVFFFVIQATFYLAAVIGAIAGLLTLRVPVLFRIPYYFCLLHTAAFWGALKSRRAKPYWEKVRS
jgi:cellulose synthase/poly-beta-1,6-N-acetylglucosamine synthase-like glycosyltransferase